MEFHVKLYYQIQSILEYEYCEFYPQVIDLIFHLVNLSK
jgi:hypothetical protein